MDPSFLGNVFEKTINHITGDAGDQKKELGAYYTPDEITRFCAEETVRPVLQEQFEEVMIEQWGWTEENHPNDDTSKPEPILGSQVAANSEQPDEEDGDVEVLAESDDE